MLEVFELIYFEFPFHYYSGWLGSWNNLQISLSSVPVQVRVEVQTELGNLVKMTGLLLVKAKQTAIVSLQEPEKIFAVDKQCFICQKSIS